MITLWIAVQTDCRAAVGHIAPDDFMELEFPYILKVRDSVKSKGMLVSHFFQKNPEIQEEIYAEGMTLMGIPVPMIFTTNYYYPKRGYFPSMEDIVKGHQTAQEKGYPHMICFLGQWLYDTSAGEIRRTIMRVFDAVGPVSISTTNVPVGTPVENIDAYTRAVRPLTMR